MKISEMKHEVLDEVDRLKEHITSQRAKRDSINADIKKSLAELQEAERFAKAFEKRTRKS